MNRYVHEWNYETFSSNVYYSTIELYLQGSRDQLQEVWEESDGLRKDDFDPRTFFMLHGKYIHICYTQTHVQYIFYRFLLVYVIYMYIFTLTDLWNMILIGGLGACTQSECYFKLIWLELNIINTCVDLNIINTCVDLKIINTCV